MITMIISIDAEKAFGNMQHMFTTKSTQQSEQKEISPSNKGVCKVPADIPGGK